MIHTNMHTRTLVNTHQAFLTKQGWVVSKLAYVGVQTCLWICMYMFKCVFPMVGQGYRRLLFSSHA